MGELLKFGQALELLEQGAKVARLGWNGKGMWLGYVAEGRYEVFDHHIKPPFTQHSGFSRLHPWVGLKAADDGFVPWQPSQADMFAKDWVVVE